jgi:hypothetical protein
MLYSHVGAILRTILFLKFCEERRALEPSTPSKLARLHRSLKFAPILSKKAQNT